MPECSFQASSHWSSLLLFVLSAVVAGVVGADFVGGGVEDEKLQRWMAGRG